MKNRFLRMGSTLSLFVLLLTSCEKEKKECPGSTQKEFAVSGFNKIEAGETFKVDIQKGANFSVKASGCSDDLSDLQVGVGNGNTLQVRYKKYRNNRYRVDLTITLPTLQAVNLSGASKTTVVGFADQQSTLRSVLSGTAECTLTGAAINTQVDLSGTAKLTVTGNTLDLYGNLSGAARLFSYDLSSKEVDIDVSGTAKAYVAPQDKLFAAASGASFIYYRGNPAVKEVTVSGAAKVINE